MPVVKTSNTRRISITRTPAWAVWLIPITQIITKCSIWWAAPIKLSWFKPTMARQNITTNFHSAKERKALNNHHLQRRLQLPVRIVRQHKQIITITIIVIIVILVAIWIVGKAVKRSSSRAMPHLYLRPSKWQSNRRLSTTYQPHNSSSSSSSCRISRVAELCHRRRRPLAPLPDCLRRINSSWYKAWWTTWQKVRNRVAVKERRQPPPSSLRCPWRTTSSSMSIRSRQLQHLDPLNKNFHSRRRSTAIIILSLSTRGLKQPTDNIRTQSLNSYNNNKTRTSHLKWRL